MYVDICLCELHCSNKLQEETEENLESLQSYVDGYQSDLLLELKGSLQDELYRYHLDAAKEYATHHDVCEVYV